MRVGGNSPLQYVSVVLIPSSSHQVKESEGLGEESVTQSDCEGLKGEGDLLSCPHYPLQGLANWEGAIPEPDSDSAAQDALDSPSVGSGEDGGWDCASLSLHRKYRCCWAFFAIALVLRDQVRFSTKWTPRNLVPLTISMEPSMYSGEWSLRALLESTTISFVLSTFRDRLLTLH